MTGEILAAIRRHARAGSAPALIGPDGAVSYAALEDAVSDAATVIGLRMDGIGPIALSLANGPAWVALDLALALQDRACVPLPPFFSQEQVRHAIASSGATHLVSDTPLDGQRLKGSWEVLGQNLHVYEADAPPVRLHDGTAKITYTSGTTGKPKGVCLSQAQLERVAASVVERLDASYADNHLCVLPLAMLLENVAGVYATLLAGGCCRFLPARDLGLSNPFAPDYVALANAVGRTRASSLILVPELLRGLTEALRNARISLPHLRLVAVGGAPVSLRLLEDASSLGIAVCQGYGLSEAGSVVSINTPADDMPGTVGRPLAHADLGVDIDGEVVLGRAGFLGYVGEPPVLGPYRTGDLGRLDANGRLTIFGRRDNLVVNAFGRNICPEWVETLLCDEDEIAQAMVYGTGEAHLSALIVVSAPSIDENAIAAAISRVNDGLPDYARIRAWSLTSPFTSGAGELGTGGTMQRLRIAENRFRQMGPAHQARPAGPDFLARLLQETEAEREVLLGVPQIRAALCGDISRATYLAYLAQAYHHVRHTVPLLELARDLMPAGKAWLSDAFDHYIEEERGHEAWILSDIRHAGGSDVIAKDGGPNPATELMIAYAYYVVREVNPVALLGMIFVLESTSSSLASTGASAVRTALSLPRSCFTYLESHGALDLEHMQFFADLLARLEDEADRQAVVRMAQRMFVLFADVFRSIPFTMEVNHAA